MKVSSVWAAITVTWIASGLIMYTYLKPRAFNDGFEAGKTEAMKQIELSNGVTNIDSSIAALKNYPNDSLNIAIFNLYATDEERKFVVQFAMWIKRIKEVR